MLRVLCPPLAALMLATTALAQEAAPDGFAPRDAMKSFQAQAGPNWQVRWDVDRGVPEHIFGGGTPYAVDGSQASFEAAARSVVGELSGALGFDASVLELDRVHLLPLSKAGTSDKVVVKLRQVLDGVAVHGGTLNVLFSSTGELLSVDNRGLPHVAAAPRAPERTLEQAAGIARQAFPRITGQPVDSLQFDDYVIYPAPIMPGKRAVRPEPAYLFVVKAPWDRASGETPVIRELAVAARGEARVLDSWSLVHQADLTGGVQGWGQGGLLPETLDPHVQLVMKDVRLQATGLPAAFSADDGTFLIPGAAGPTSVTATLNGLYSRVVNAAGAESTITQTVTPGSFSTFTFNPAQAQQQTAEVNAHVSVEAMRDWVRALDLAETKFNFQVVSNVNIGATCNAFYDGFSINFYLAGGGCPNTAYSTVVWHEEGHWANDLYGSGNGFDGFGEGAADVWAMYIADNPVVADGFFGPGTNIRTGLNTRQFCGDSSPGCYGQVHADGEVLGGAIWKVRANLKTDFGAAAGGAIADQLMLGWFQAFNDGQIKSIIEEHWLVLDDDDANINNGTPHYPTIDAGFLAQGFPGFVLPLFGITHTPVTLVGHEGPVTISADIVEEQGTLASATLHYSFDDGGSWANGPMTLVSGSTYAGTIPGVISPARVGYYIEATDTGGDSNTLPKTAPGVFFSYDVGTITEVAFYDFEPVGDEGWTHQQILAQDDWQHGPPLGSSATDPTTAWSGTRIWGNDLGPSGWNGDYQPNVHNILRSPTFNLTGVTNSHLRFRRWLSVEDAFFDQATIRLNGTQIWQNQATPGGVTHHLDGSWVFQDLDISALADNQPSVQVTFEMQSDGGLQFGGWNIDDLSVVSIGPVGSVFIAYGAGTPGFGGLPPLLEGSGDATPGGTVTLDVSGANPSSTGALFIGTTQAAIPALGGTFLVGNLITSIPLSTNGLGELTISGALPNDPGLVGVTITHQHWVLDPAGPAGKAGSNGLEYTIQ